jgi:hypothetical protein
VNATSKKLSYVTAFTGMRDSYQLPLALAEHGRLAAFATCFYRDRGLAGGLARMFPRRRSPSHQRHAAGLELASIETLEFTNLAARLGQRIVYALRTVVMKTFRPQNFLNPALLTAEVILRKYDIVPVDYNPWRPKLTPLVQSSAGAHSSISARDLLVVGAYLKQSSPIHVVGTKI